MSLNLGTTVKLSHGGELPLVGFGTYKIDSEKPIRIKHIDTAALYKNEDIVASAIEKSKFKRSDIFITTKLGHTEMGYESTLKAADESLKKLNTDYVDLYLVHWPEKRGSKGTNKQDRQDTWRAMEQLHKEGKCKSIGVSNFTVKHLKEMEEYATVFPSVNQIEYHVMNTQNDLVNFCEKKKVHIMSFRTLGSGKLLTNDKVVEFAKKYKKAPSQILLRWCIQNGVSIIPKSQKEERIKENYQIFDFDVDKEDIKKLNGMDEGKWLSTFGWYGKKPTEVL